MTDHACLVVHGPDQPGLVSVIAALITRNKGNIISLDQHSSDPEDGGFFQRIVFHRQNLVTAMDDIRADLTETLEPYDMAWSLSDRSQPKRMAVLWRQRRGDLPVSIPMVISNHTDTVEDVRSFGVPFFHVPSQAGPDKSESEAEILRLLKGNVDFIVLARYMQIISSDFLEQVGVPVINIHHSFLPAFIGAAPYRKAKERGVKLVGATAHYVTENLDEGPIIEQDVVRVNHRDNVADLKRLGAEVERSVLSRAVLWHAQDKVIRNGNTTIVF
ncbi:MAG: formyltetrahydrofolate deformylase [Corynebacterium sp.]|nr:formyltetrahydrofolate deformylase [Corynebacterium sp.]